jgi:hypothetical protein
MPPLLRRVLILLASLVLASCATVPPTMPADPSHPGLPPVSKFDRGIGTDRVFCLSLQGEHGEKWRFLVDSGSPITIFDQSLRSKLGPSLGEETVRYAWSGPSSLQVHNAPHVFLNGTLLLLGPHVWSDDLRHVWSGRFVQGILGLDCLRHYCVQLDFPNHVVRFLDPEHPGGAELGQSFPLYTIVNSVFVQGDLLGTGPMLYQVDTGCTVDAVMMPELFRQAWLRQPPTWVRQFASAEGRPVVEGGFAHATFGGQAYDRVIVDAASHNFLGLRFLSRHVVTLNFPKHTMYLQRVD